MSAEFDVVTIHDDDSLRTRRFVIKTPTGRLLSLSEFQNGKEVFNDREKGDCWTIVNALNWILTNGPDIIDTETT